MKAEITAEMELVLRDWLENSDNMETPGLRHSTLMLLNQQQAEIQRLRFGKSLLAQMVERDAQNRRRRDD